MTQQFRFVMIAFFGFFSTLNAQEIDSVQVKKHLYTLASDEMQGGRTGTARIEKVAKYIEGEFKRMGLKNYADLSSYSELLLLHREGRIKIPLSIILSVFWKEKAKKMKW